MSRLDRRDLLKISSAVPFLGGAEALAADGKKESVGATDDAPRGKKGILTRMPSLDLESQVDYLTGHGKWAAAMAAESTKRSEDILRAHGIDPNKRTDMTLKDIIPLLENDPVIAMKSRLGSINHYKAFTSLQRYFHNNADYYLSTLKAAEKKGPGALDLNRSLVVPDYTKHEIHNQIGGYSGDPFAGMIYFYGTLTLFDAKNEQDAGFDATAAAVPVPSDGKVRRILDNGTGPGQFATSLKRRFPDAEVWGIDVSGPMVRYAHHRANQMGVNVNFANRLAEDNGFPDNYFDIVVSTSFHHELTAEASKKVFMEAQRTLRKGGVYRPADSGINGYPQTPLGKVNTYLAWRQNHEVWMMEWAEMDRLGAIAAAGLKLDASGAFGGNGAPWLTTINVAARKV